MGEQSFFDLGWVNVDATPDDHVIGTPREMQKPITVEPTKVPRIEPTLTKRYRAGLRVSIKSIGNSWSAIADVAYFASRHHEAVTVHDFDIDAEHYSAHGRRLFDRVMRHQDRHPTALGRAIVVYESGTQSVHDVGALVRMQDCAGR